jgi:hypothetical protein
MSRPHVAVWIDHKEARIFHVDAETLNAATVKAPTHHLHKHPKGPQGAKEHPDDAKRFFHEVVRELEGAEALLILGPSTAKLHLIRYMHEHARSLEPKIVGIETVDHPTDGQLLAYARTYFKASDRMM